MTKKPKQIKSAKEGLTEITPKKLEDNADIYPLQKLKGIVEERSEDTPIVSVPKNTAKVDRNLTPVVKDEDTELSPGKVRKSKADALPAGVKQGKYDFNAPTGRGVVHESVMTPRMAKLRAKRVERGMGLPGSENGVLDTAIMLTKKHQEEANKSVRYHSQINPLTNQMEHTAISKGHSVFGRAPGDDSPITHETVGGTVQERMAQVHHHYKTDEKGVSKLLAGTGTPIHKKYEVLHAKMLQEKAASHSETQTPGPDDVWKDPKTGLNVPFSHPDAPKLEVKKGATETKIIGKGGRPTYSSVVEGWHPIEPHKNAKEDDGSEAPKGKIWVEHKAPVGIDMRTDIINTLNSKTPGTTKAQRIQSKMQKRLQENTALREAGETPESDALLGMQKQTKVRRGPDQKILISQGPDKPMVEKKFPGRIHTKYKRIAPEPGGITPKHENYGVDKITGRKRVLPYKSTAGMTVHPPEDKAQLPRLIAEDGSINPTPKTPKLFNAVSEGRSKQFEPTLPGFEGYGKVEPKDNPDENIKSWKRLKELSSSIKTANAKKEQDKAFASYGVSENEETPVSKQFAPTRVATKYKKQSAKEAALAATRKEPITPARAPEAVIAPYDNSLASQPGRNQSIYPSVVPLSKSQFGKDNLQMSLPEAPADSPEHAKSSTWENRTSWVPNKAGSETSRLQRESQTGDYKKGLPALTTKKAKTQVPEASEPSYGPEKAQEIQAEGIKTYIEGRRRKAESRQFNKS